MPPQELAKTTNIVVVKKEILHENHFYDVTEWVKKHPGGKIIEFYTQSGEDATIAIQQFHQRSTKRVMSIMNTLKKRPADQSDVDFISVHHKALTEDFTNLFQEFTDEGLFEPAIPNLIGRLIEWLAFCSLGLHFLHSENAWLWIFGLFSMTMFVGRAGWLEHEGGHHSLTGNPRVDRLLQGFLLEKNYSDRFCVLHLGDLPRFSFGLSGAFWRSQHNRHHAMPQRLQRDVDLETMPFLAFNKQLVKNPKDGNSFFIRYQAYLFLTLDTLLITLFWKFYLHPKYAWKKGAYADLTFMAWNLGFIYALGPLNYILVLWLAAVYTLGNFALSHTHLPVTTEPLHWAEYALLHTTNIDSSWLCDWWMGYLNFQIEHHLFPTMPQFRHKLIAPRVKEFAKKHGIPYRCVSYWQAVAQSFANLHQVSKDVSSERE